MYSTQEHPASIFSVTICAIRLPHAGNVSAIVRPRLADHYIEMFLYTQSEILRLGFLLRILATLVVPKNHSDYKSPLNKPPNPRPDLTMDHTMASGADRSEIVTGEYYIYIYPYFVTGSLAQRGAGSSLEIPFVAQTSCGSQNPARSSGLRPF